MVQRKRNKEQTREYQLADKPMDTCKKCKNVYRIIWSKVGKNWNDFGFRYCPFCGTQTDKFAPIR